MDRSITAIVPTYNRAHFLTEALAALRAQTRPVDEIIVWDDGSSDDTEAVVRADDGPIRYFRSENGGKSRALNAALAHARGDYIWICDDDDLSLPRAAETLAAPLDANPAIGVSGGSYRRFRTDPATGARVELGPGHWPDLSHGSVLRHLLEDFFLFQNATLVRRSCFDVTGPFREDLPRSLDYDMIIRLAARFPVCVTGEAVFLQREHDGARGPAAARHAAEKSIDVWKQVDRMVFAPFREGLPLSLYEAMFDAPGAAAQRRAALLQRGCVFARRADWQTALEDFTAAAAACPDAALSPAEQAICRRAMASKYGYAEAMEPEVRTALARLARSSPAGAGIARALLRGLVWRVRHAARARDGAQLRKLAGTFLRVGAAAPLPRGTPLPGLTERSALPPEAYEILA